jgi:branched-chain amino acid transport system permease protein
MVKRENALVATLRENAVLYAILAFLLLFPHIVGWLTGDSPFGVGGRPRGQSVFWQAILIEVFVFAVLAMSYNLIFGFTGMISFGHALFFGLGGYTLGIVIEMAGFDDPTLAFIVGFVLAIGLAGLVGFLIGLASLRLKGVYFAIFTLAVAEMAFIWVSRWPLTNAEDGFPLSSLPTLLNPTQNRLGYYYITLIIAVATFWFIRRLMNSPTGRVLLAIRENEQRAVAIGFDTLRYKLISITIASMLAALAGIMLVILNKKVGPELMSLKYTIDPLLMVIIGGLGTFTGPVLGAAGLHLSGRIFNRELMIGSTSINIGEYWSLILGVAFVIVVLVFPYGIVGTWNRWRTRSRQKIKRVASSND